MCFSYILQVTKSLINWFFVKPLVEKMTHLLSWVLSLCLNGSEVKFRGLTNKKRSPENSQAQDWTEN